MEHLNEVVGNPQNISEHGIFCRATLFEKKFGFGGRG